MSAAQHYHPYRAQLISREQLRELNELDPAAPVRDTILGWLWIVAAWILVALYPVWWVIVPAIAIIGTRYYALSIIGHDGLHRRLFESIRINDLWNDLFIMGPVGAITRINRENHIEHHRATCLPHDPDRHKYVHDHKYGTFKYIFFLSGAQSVYPTLMNVFAGGNRDREARSLPERYRARDIAIVVGWQAGLISVLSFGIGWWAYPVLWLLPVYLFAYRADLVRVFCEHSMMTTDLLADEHRRMITYSSNWLERQFFAPHNMNFHTAHHLWPSIPYYNLPKADAAIRERISRSGGDDNLVWRRSYLGYLCHYLLWRRAQARLVPAYP